VIGTAHDIRGMKDKKLLALAALAAALACGDNSLDPLPFQVSVTANTVSPALGDSVSFAVSAQGGQLVGMDVDYGDTSTDAFGTGGARTARVTFRHAYSARGTFQFRATVTDALAGQKDATVDVRVQ
jgi:hypothetical protein